VNDIKKGDIFTAARICKTEYIDPLPYHVYEVAKITGGEFEEAAARRELVISDVPEQQFIFLGWVFLTTGKLLGTSDEYGDYYSYAFRIEQRVKVAVGSPLKGTRYLKNVYVMPEDIMESVGAEA
jgi:hypothetical protein